MLNSGCQASASTSTLWAIWLEPVQILFQMCCAYIEINFFIAWNKNTNFTNANNEKIVLHILQQALGKSPQSCGGKEKGFLSLENMLIGYCSYYDDS